MKVINHTKYRIFQFRQYNPKAELNLVVTAVAHFDIGPDGALKLAGIQPEPLLADRYFGENPHGHLQAQADFVPYKPAGDVTVLAQSHSPTGRPERGWSAEVHIRDRVKRLSLHGPRFWIPRGQNDWQLGVAEPALVVPVDFYRAFGGPVLGTGDAEKPADVCSENPLGPGIIREGVTPGGAQIVAPQIEDPAEPLRDWRQSLAPVGLAPIPPYWAQRAKLAGTYDETWIRTQHPFLPPDFDYAFYNCATSDLQLPHALIPGERVRLVNLHARLRDVQVFLPREIPGLVVRYGDEDRRLPMLMDGAHFDLLAEIPGLRVTWRSAIPLDRRPIAELHIGLIPQLAET